MLAELVGTELLSELTGLVSRNLFRVDNSVQESRTFKCKHRCDMTFCLTPFQERGERRKRKQLGKNMHFTLQGAAGKEL